MRRLTVQTSSEVLKRVTGVPEYFENKCLRIRIIFNGGSHSRHGEQLDILIALLKMGSLTNFSRKIALVLLNFIADGKFD